MPNSKTISTLSLAATLIISVSTTCNSRISYLASKTIWVLITSVATTAWTTLTTFWEWASCRTWTWTIYWVRIHLVIWLLCSSICWTKEEELPISSSFRSCRTRSNSKTGTLTTTCWWWTSKTTVVSMETQMMLVSMLTTLSTPRLSWPDQSK